MVLLDLPRDVIYSIISLGNLSVMDVLRLSETNSRMYYVLRSEFLWKKLYKDNWGDLLDSYELCLPGELDDLGTSYFKRSLTLFHRQQHLEHELGMYYILSPTHNITMFLDKFTTDPYYIPIIYNLLQWERTRISTNLLFQTSYSDLTRVAVLTNLMYAQNYRVALRYCEYVDNTEDFDEVSLEYSLFRLSFFDPASQDLAKDRRRSLEKIKVVLHREIYVKLLTLGKIGNFTYKSTPKGETMTFRNERSFIKFVLKVAKLIMSNFSYQKIFSIVDSDKYGDTLFLEDCSILRIYSGLCKGGDQWILSILSKCLQEFMDEFSLFIGTKPVDFKALVTKKFLKINKYFFMVRPIGDVYKVEVFSYAELAANLRTNNYDNVTMNNFLSPITVKDTLNMIRKMECLDSVSSIANTERGFLGGLSTMDLIWSLFMNHQDVEFVSFLVGMHKVAIDTKRLKQYMSVTNNFIHFNSIYRIARKSQKTHLLEEELLVPSDINDHEISRSCFSLLERDSLVSFEKIFHNLFTGKGFIKDDVISTGSIVRHSRFGTLGINFGKVKTFSLGPKYLQVYSSSKSTDVYRENSLVKIDEFHYDSTLYLLKSCGLDILGLFFFAGVQASDSNIQFVPFA